MTTSSTINNAAGTVTGMADRAHQAVERVADKAAPGLERARTTAHNTIDKVADQAASGVDWAANNGKQLVRRGAELSEVACDYVRERPLVAVAGALGIGYLIGRLMR